MAEVGERSRIAWLDRARGIGIVLVVLGHALLSVDRSGLVEDRTVVTALETAIYSFHMPLFFVLAGIGQTLSTGSARSLGPLRAIGWGLVYPYLLWSLVWIGLKSAFPGASNTGVEEPAVAILWMPIDQFWFLYVLAMVRLVWWAVEALDRRWLTQAAIVLPLAVALVGFQSEGGPFSLWSVFWAAFFGLGVALGPNLDRVPSGGLWLLLAGSAALWLAGLPFLPGLQTETLTAVVTGTAIAGSAMVLAASALVPRAETLLARALSLLGEASLAIFLTHTIVGAGARIVLSQLGLLEAGSLAIVATLLGLALPTAGYVVLMALDRRMGLRLVRLAGFGTARRLHALPLPPTLVNEAGRAPATD